MLYGRMTDAALAAAASSGPWIADERRVPQGARVDDVGDPCLGTAG